MRVLNQKFVMGYGGRARGGSTSTVTSRKESNEGSKEKKEKNPTIEKISAEEIRKLVACGQHTRGLGNVRRTNGPHGHSLVPKLGLQ